MYVVLASAQFQIKKKLFSLKPSIVKLQVDMSYHAVKCSLKMVIHTCIALKLLRNYTSFSKIEHQNTTESLYHSGFKYPIMTTFTKYM